MANKNVLDTVMAVNMEITTPMPRVRAKPLTADVPNQKRMIAVMIEEMFESRIESHALEKPSRMLSQIFLPRLSSSFILSKIKIFASTAMPLKGKILNIERARLDRMLESEQIKNLVVALGTAIGDTFDIAKLRYHKIIIATDADVDGAHIRTLILTLLYRFFRPLIDGGFIYIAQPPLYKIKKGKEIFYAYSDEEKTKVVGKEEIEEIEEVEAGGNEAVGPESADEGGEEENTKNKKPKTTKISIQRYKGLGEMNAEELWETTMDPARRILKQVAIADAVMADKIFDILMGTDVPSRKSFIQSNATKATLDI